MQMCCSIVILNCIGNILETNIWNKWGYDEVKTEVMDFDQSTIYCERRKEQNSTTENDR